MSEELRPAERTESRLTTSILRVHMDEEPDWVSATILDACEMLEGT